MKIKPALWSKYAKYFWWMPGTRAGRGREMSGCGSCFCPDYSNA